MSKGKEKGSPSEKVLKVWVQPRSARNEVIGFRGEFLRVRVTAPPERGEANNLCRELLAEALGVPPSQVEILSGQGARWKRVRIWGASEERWQNLRRWGEVSE